jgi:UDP-glucose 4-epimerase
MTRTLITGGGFLGQRLARHLLAQGQAVRLLDIAPTPAADLDWQQGDVASPDDVARALAGCDQVVHLAALLTPACAAQPMRGAQVNLLGSLNVFEAARQAGLRHVVYASSAGVFGPEQALHPAPTTLYGTWKLATEGIARAYLADHGIGSVGLRPFVVYGAGREVGLSSGPSLACRAAVQGQPYTIPFTGRCGLVHVDDVVRALAAALRPAQPGAWVFNMPGVIASMDEVIAEITRQVPSAQLRAEGPPRPIAADMPTSDWRAVLGPLAVTSLAEGLAATLAACRVEAAATAERARPMDFTARCDASLAAYERTGIAAPSEVALSTLEAKVAASIKRLGE